VKAADLQKKKAEENDVDIILKEDTPKPAVEEVP